MDSLFSDFVLFLDMRLSAEKIRSDGNPKNFLTQTLPTIVSAPLSLFRNTQTSMMGKWPHRQVVGSSSSYTSNYSYLKKLKFGFQTLLPESIAQLNTLKLIR